MKVVIDTNILIAAFLRTGVTREILLDYDHDFLVPEFALEEFERHLPELAERMDQPLEKARIAFLLLIEHVDVVEQSVYSAHYDQAVQESATPIRTTHRSWRSPMQ